MGDVEAGRAQELFDAFVQAPTCRAALRCFGLLCESLGVACGGGACSGGVVSSGGGAPEKPLYKALRQRLSYWRADALWAKLDRRAAHVEYMGGRACAHTTCVIIGAGPCGLRTAVELALMGARVVLLEKGDAFSRNNVLHLWPFAIHDLRGLGAKRLYGKFCGGSIDHISIRQLQLVLLKVALLVGVEVHVNVEFLKLVEPPDNLRHKDVGWRVEVHPKNHPVSQLEIDVVVGADGRRNTLPGFKRKEFRGKLAIAMTANFRNRNTAAEAKVEEISGVASIFNQRFFQELRQETGIDLENIVYYKDDTHYFVMTTKKQSLLEKGVILQDHTDTEQLLSRGNVDQNALQAYARQAADFSTGRQLPTLDFAMNRYGQPDVAVFDFTCMYASENAALVRRRGHRLLVTLVGDSLLEPFWPMGTGIARGFLAALDSAWMIRRWAQGHAPEDLLAERESSYRFLPQTTPENINKNIDLYTVDPVTRYPNLTSLLVTPAQVRHLIDTEEETGPGDKKAAVNGPLPVTLQRQESVSSGDKLLSWCQEQTRGYRGVAVSDLSTSWKSGLALCALIHHHRPPLIDFDSLEEARVVENTRMAFDVAEQELGISPLMTVEEMSSVGEPDSLSVAMYLSQFYQLFRDTLPSSGSLCQSSDLRAALLSHCPSSKRIPKLTNAGGNQDNQEEEGLAGRSRVRLIANRLQAKLEEGAASRQSPSSSADAVLRRQGESVPGSTVPAASYSADPLKTQPASLDQSSTWRPKKRTQQQEQMSFRFKEKIMSHSVPSRGQQLFVQRHSEGVSSLAEQIVSQLQSQQDVMPAPANKELVVRSAHVVTAPAASDVCFFCGRRVYVMERQSAEGLFFHRSCFRCARCHGNLRTASYSFDAPSGSFYCLQHDDMRLSDPVQRNTAASAVSSDQGTAHRGSIDSVVSVAPMGSSTDTVISRAGRASGASLMEQGAGPMGRRAPWAKTPERIELENCSGEPLEEEKEVTEEKASYNLSLPGRSAEVSSSESEMDEMEAQHPVTSDPARESWRQIVALHSQQRRGKEKEGDEDEEEGGVDEEWEEKESDTESSDEGEYSPWQMERHSGLWLLLEETEEEFSPAPLDSGRASLHPPGDEEEEEAQEPDSTAPDSPPASSSRHGNTPSAVSLPGTPSVCSSSSSTTEEEAGGRGVLSLDPQSLMEGLVPRLLGKAVFPSNRGDNKKKRGGASLPDKVARRKGSQSKRATDSQASSSFSWTEESDVASSTAVKRCSLNLRANLHVELSDLAADVQRLERLTMQEEDEKLAEPAYGPHALAFKRAYAVKRCTAKGDKSRSAPYGGRGPPGGAEGAKLLSSLGVSETMFQSDAGGAGGDRLGARITRRVQKVARRQAKQEQLKRLHKAQIIQRQIEQVEEKQKQLEERGVAVEKALRGEADYWGDGSFSEELDLNLGGLSKLDNPALMQQWFQLVQQKNTLVRYESELMIFARELELEDRQSRLQQELRERMAVGDHLKCGAELAEERVILEEMLEVVEQRDALVSLLEEQRVQERREDRDLEAVMLSRGLGLHWA